MLSSARQNGQKHPIMEQTLYLVDSGWFFTLSLRLSLVDEKEVQGRVPAATTPHYDSPVLTYYVRTIEMTRTATAAPLSQFLTVSTI